MRLYAAYMTGGVFLRVAVACLLHVASATGCQTGGGSAVKARGVYTTLATANPGLDMADAQYSQKSSFGPGETPAAVVVGFGDYARPQPMTLELIEVSTGRSLFSKPCAASYGMALMHPLSIRLSGEYKVRILVDGTEFDSFQFSVSRTNHSGGLPVANPNPGTDFEVKGFGWR